MNALPYDIRDLVQRACRDRALWDEITAPEDLRGDVYAELERVHRDVGNQINARSAELGLIRDDEQAGTISSQEARRKRREHQLWVAKAVRFRSVIDERIGELRPFVASTHRRLSEHNGNLHDLINTLVLGIYHHQSEVISDADLYALLEKLRKPDADVTLFELAAQ